MCEPHLQWLKHNSEPWTDVIEHWKASRPARTKDMATWNGNIHLLFTKWPILRHPQAYTLVNILIVVLLFQKGRRSHVCDYF